MNQTFCDLNTNYINSVCWALMKDERIEIEAIIAGQPDGTGRWWNGIRIRFQGYLQNRK
jgi:hypothetical protein